MKIDTPAVRSLAIVAGLLFVFSAPNPVAARKLNQPVATIGSLAPDFTLPDSLGQKHKLSSYLGKKIVVLEWLNYDCPFVGKQYRSKNMQKLQEQYTAKGVVWFSIISSAPGKQGYYKAIEVNKINQEREGHATAILLDPKGIVGRRYDAKTTPDMFVVNQKGTLVYAGAIDDKPSTELEDVLTAHNFVREALDDVLADQPLKTPYTKSYGCSVKY